MDWSKAQDVSRERKKEEELRAWGEAARKAGIEHTKDLMQGLVRKYSDTASSKRLSVHSSSDNREFLTAGKVRLFYNVQADGVGSYEVEFNGHGNKICRSKFSSDSRRSYGDDGRDVGYYNLLLPMDSSAAEKWRRLRIEPGLNRDGLDVVVYTCSIESGRRRIGQASNLANNVARIADVLEGNEPLESWSGHETWIVTEEVNSRWWLNENLFAEMVNADSFGSGDDLSRLFPFELVSGGIPSVHKPVADKVTFDSLFGNVPLASLVKVILVLSAVGLGGYVAIRALGWFFGSGFMSWVDSM
jgi:hypothetical protein